MMRTQWIGLALFFGVGAIASILTVGSSGAVPVVARFPDEQITIIIYDALFAFLTLAHLTMGIACAICAGLEKEEKR